MGLARRMVIAAIVLVSLGSVGIAATSADEDRPLPGVGITRERFAAVFADSDVAVLSDIGGVVALESKDPEVEFERYVFTLPAGVQPSRLWQITIGYRMPADRGRFERAEAWVTERYGPPTQSTSREAEHGEPPFERRVWDSGVTVVTLAGCPDGETTDEASRMQITVVDRELQRLGLAQRRGRPKKA
jgi:hypothetical protein